MKPLQSLSILSQTASSAAGVPATHVSCSTPAVQINEPDEEHAPVPQDVGVTT